MDKKMKKSLLYTGFLFLGLGLGTVSVLAQTAPVKTVSTTGSLPSETKKTATVTTRKVATVDGQAVRASVARQEPESTQQVPTGTGSQTVPAATNQSRTPQKAAAPAKPIVKPTQEKVLPKSRVAQ